MTEGLRTRVRFPPPPPTPQPQPFSVGVFSCQTARNPANRLGFLRTAADLPLRPPTPTLGPSPLSPGPSSLQPWPTPRARSPQSRKFLLFRIRLLYAGSSSQFFSALGGGGKWASSPARRQSERRCGAVVGGADGCGRQEGHDREPAEQPTRAPDQVPTKPLAHAGDRGSP